MPPERSPKAAENAESFEQVFGNENSETQVRLSTRGPEGCKDFRSLNVRVPSGTQRFGLDFLGGQLLLGKS